MKQETKLKEVAGKGSPFTVPDNYFESFKKNLIDNLPEYPEKPAEKSVSVWHRIRPYFYLAAMFAGIWCMMKIFYHVGGMDSNQGVDPDVIALANYEPDSYDFYINPDDGDDLELQDEVTDLYASMDDFKRDFYNVNVD